MKLIAKLIVFLICSIGMGFLSSSIYNAIQLRFNLPPILVWEFMVFSAEIIGFCSLLLLAVLHVVELNISPRK